MPSALAALPVDTNELYGPPLRSPPAHRIRDDTDAIAVAEEVSAELSKRAVERETAREVARFHRKHGA